MTPHPLLPAASHAHGLGHDLDTLARQMAGRRQWLRWLATGAGACAMPLVLGACGGAAEDGSATTSTGSSGSTTSTTTTTSSSGGSCSSIPSETAGPYPADGSLASSQRLNALTLSGIVRSDIRSSVGGASGTAAGVPLTLTLQLVNTAASCANLQGLAVYVWHCTREGGYSMYSSGITGQNYLRGVQVSDANGQVSFTTIFPGCYSGRWPHIHFEVYPNLLSATDSSQVSDYERVSQLALPASFCNQVYGVVAGYEASVANFAGISLASDNVFGNDGAALQMATVSGDVASGFTATLQVGI
ncbi:intradiol ring-cleavage dioxygenase [Hydrogenophaga sp.]|uniref:dioxygenase family protein n=1 Tax=Hydrogenophaga sp. TaxID=1904254 RepID=UPI0026317727|nr:intradiol ring-cleavage dioxygenase [Hydrogenophaga sp.]MCW5654871.1 intradiol ring-cleavage dioxygenase [Hydrogenophaga sp.]